MLEWLRRLDERVLGRPGLAADDSRAVRAGLWVALVAATMLAAGQVAGLVMAVTGADPARVLLPVVGTLCWVVVGVAAALRLRRRRAHR